MTQQNDGLPDTQALYAWVARDARGNEGVIVAPLPKLGLLPLVMADEANARRLRSFAATAAQERQQIARLVRYVRDVELDKVEP